MFSCVCADATQPEAYRRALGEQKADLLLTDPPYCLLTRRRKGGDPREPKHRKIDRGPVRRFEDVREYRGFTRTWLKLAAEQLTSSAPMVVWTNLLGKEPIVSSARELGWQHLHGEFVWGKRTREGNSGEEILRVVEVALVMSRIAAAPQTVEAPATCWSVVAGYDDDGEAARWGAHPNHKPFGVLEPLVRTYSRPGQTVLDCFAGSGSIPAAALRLGRRAVALELEPEWAQRVSERLEKSST